MQESKDLKYWVGFSSIQGIGRLRFQVLEKAFPSLEEAWRASTSDLLRAGMDQRAASAIVATRPKLDLDGEMEKLARYKVQALTWNDPSYPPKLKEIYDLPPVLYVRGALMPQDDWTLAVVGTRRATAYGKEVTERIVTDLARNRITIASGLARGIDYVAHRSAIDAGGRTIAALACGLDLVYPAEHLSLAREIMEHGALISEYPLETRPRAEHFPRRNRLLSGIGLGVLVVEAPEASGALITANLALEQNREVFATPGSILSLVSRGTNRLIQDGAKLVLSFQDILEELNLSSVAQQMEMKELLPVTDLESKVLKLLSSSPKHIDEVGRESGLPIATISSALAMLELKGMAKQVGAMNFVLGREAPATYSARG